jgi:glycosyltransferase involved in cell wall biosynthesis
MTAVLHLIDTTGPGGAETVFLELIKASKKNGYTPIAVVRGEGWVEDQLKLIGCEYYVIDCKGSFNIRFLLALISLLRKKRVSLVQTHLFGSAIYGAMAAWITRTPAICTLHGMVDIGDNERFLWLKRKAVALGASKVVTVTDQLYNKVKSLKLIPENRLVKIYNGIDTTIFANKGRALFREQLGLRKEDVVIGSLGNIRKPKNYPLAIDTIAQLHAAGCKAHYLVAGQGNDDQMAPLLAQVNKFNLDKYVHFLGFVSDTPEFLSSLDVFLMTSSSEGHPLALTQAMAVGVPLVSTPSGVQETVANDTEGLITATHSARELAEGISSFLQSQVQAERIVSAAKLKVRSCFSLGAMLGRYIELYRTV